MVLQNYWSWRRGVADAYQNRQQSATTFTVPIKDIEGVSCTQANTGTQLNSNTENYQGTSMHFGLSDTPVSALDYSLGNDITNDLTIVQVKNVTCESTNMKIIYTPTVTNNTANDVVIKEIGIVKAFSGGALVTGTVSGHTVLMVRHVLDTPITIAAGASKSIEYEWVMQ